MFPINHNISFTEEVTSELGLDGWERCDGQREQCAQAWGSPDPSKRKPGWNSEGS